jgi:hypothetical protein
MDDTSGASFGMDAALHERTWQTHLILIYS